jgi:hypothetical protein
MHRPEDDNDKEKTTMKLINRTSHSTKPMLLVAVLMAICSFTVAANAQSQFVGNFTLPYEVQWNHAVLPAGEYTIRLASKPGPAVVSATNGSRSIYTAFPIIAGSGKGGASLLITIVGHQHTVRSMNLPLLGVSLIFQPLTRNEREELAKVGQLESVPVMTAKK